MLLMTLVVVAFLICVEGFEEENNCYNNNDEEDMIE